MYLYLGILLLTVNLILADFSLGPHDILLKQMGKCSNEGTREVKFLDGRIRKKAQEKYSLTTNIIFENDIETKIFNLDLDLSSMGGNGVWREHFYYHKGGKFCDSFKLMLPKFFATFLKASGMKCEKFIRKGNYSIRDMDLAVDFHLPFIPYGNYKCDVILQRKVKRVGCFQLLIDVVPKRN